MTQEIQKNLFKITLGGVGVGLSTIGISMGLISIIFEINKYEVTSQYSNSEYSLRVKENQSYCGEENLHPYILRNENNGTIYNGVIRRVENPTDFDFESVRGGLEKIVAPTEDGDETTFERNLNCETLGQEPDYTSFEGVPEHLQGVYKKAFDKGSQRVEEIFGAFSKQALQAYEDRLEQEKREEMKKIEKYEEAIHNL